MLREFIGGEKPESKRFRFKRREEKGVLGTNVRRRRPVSKRVGLLLLRRCLLLLLLRWALLLLLLLVLLELWMLLLLLL
jgi:hypothetical protein